MAIGNRCLMKCAATVRGPFSHSQAETKEEDEGEEEEEEGCGGCREMRQALIPSWQHQMLFC